MAGAGRSVDAPGRWGRAAGARQLHRGCGKAPKSSGGLQALLVVGQAANVAARSRTPVWLPKSFHGDLQRRQRSRSGGAWLGPPAKANGGHHGLDPRKDRNCSRQCHHTLANWRSHRLPPSPEAGGPSSEGPFLSRPATPPRTHGARCQATQHRARAWQEAPAPAAAAAAAMTPGCPPPPLPLHPTRPTSASERWSSGCALRWRRRRGRRRIPRPPAYRQQAPARRSAWPSSTWRACHCSQPMVRLVGRLGAVRCCCCPCLKV